MVRRSLLVGLVLATLVAVLPANSFASTPSTHRASCGRSFGPKIRRQLHRIVTVVHTTYRTPGMAAAAIVPGKGCWVSATGYANKERRQPLSGTDEFPIGSITLTFTATVILQLVQDEKLSLSAPISTWVPSVQDADNITVEMLLTMTSGIAEEPNGVVLSQIAADPTKVWSPQDVVATAVAQGPAKPPGSYYYSNTNYVILGMIAQAITGEPINELISNQILRPLRLRHTYFPTSTPPPGLVHGYSVEGIKGLGRQTVADVTSGYNAPAYALGYRSPGYISFAGAAGAMVSTLGDLQTWAKAFATGELLSPSMQRDQQLITSQSQPFGFFSPLPSTGGYPLPWRYGLGVLNLDGMFGQDGIVTGFRAAMFYEPAKRATIIVLLNGTDPEGEGQIGTFLSDAAAVSIAYAVL